MTYPNVPNATELTAIYREAATTNETLSDAVHAGERALWLAGWNARDREPTDKRVRECRQLLARFVKYVREDRAETPGSTRLARLTEQVADYLSRTWNPRDVLRGQESEEP